MLPSTGRLGATLQRLAKNRIAPSLFMVGLAIGAFGLLIPRFGFFWDDWPNVWFLHLFGPAGTLRAYTVDRPFMGVVYLFTTSWLGVEPGPWHLFALTTRILSALAFWSLVKRIWPGESARNLAIALLFLIYPSFRQQPVAIIYGHFFLLFAIHLASLSFTLRAL